MIKKLIQLFVLLFSLYAGWYVGTRLETEDPFAPSKIFAGTRMSQEEKAADPLRAVSLTRAAVDMLYKACGDVTALFEKEGIDYWATCGTLLGVVRHEGLIPYDDDLDFCIEEKDAPRVLALKDKLNSLGYDVFQDRTSIKIYKVNGPHVKPKKRSFKILDGLWFVRRKTERFPTIDIYPTKKEGTQIIHANHRARKSFYTEVYQDGDIYPLKEYRFGPIHIKGPRNPFNFFTTNYGYNWDEVLVFYGSHVDGSHERISVPLTPEIRQKIHRFSGVN